MQIISILQIALLAIYQADALSIGNREAFIPKSPAVLTKRANPTGVQCGPPENQQVWSLEVVQTAYAALETNDSLPRPRKPAAGGRVYPRQYGSGADAPDDESVTAALDAIPECTTRLAGRWKWFEFPLTDPTFAGRGPQGSQGPDRVIAIAKNIGQGGTRSFIYCLAVTHRGAQKPGDFNPCPAIASINELETE
ncbi:MAG: hypothetical protein Q9177_001185 [Variospora cf. flavescens]